MVNNVFLLSDTIYKNTSVIPKMIIEKFKISSFTSSILGISKAHFKLSVLNINSKKTKL